MRAAALARSLTGSLAAATAFGGLVHLVLSAAGSDVPQLETLESRVAGQYVGSGAETRSRRLVLDERGSYTLEDEVSAGTDSRSAGPVESGTWRVEAQWLRLQPEAEDAQRARLEFDRHGYVSFELEGARYAALRPLDCCEL